MRGGCTLPLFIQDTGVRARYHTSFGSDCALFKPDSDGVITPTMYYVIQSAIQQINMQMKM